MEQRSDMPFLTDGTNNYTLEPNKVFTVGRSLGNSLIIADLKISRTHCIFKEENGMWTVHDQSGNGTYINDIRLHNSSKTLSHGDKLRLSESTSLEFHDAQSSVEEEISICEKVDETVYRILKPWHTQNVPSTSGRTNQTQEEARKTEIEQPQTSAISTATVVLEERKPGPSSAKQAEDMENEMMCSICAELFVKAQTLNCSHTFCRMCINQWKNKSKICPICRAKIKTVTPTLVLDNIIEKMMETSPEDVQQHRKQLLADREQEEKPKTVPKRSNRGRRRGNQQSGRNANPQPTADVLLISSDDEDADTDPYDFFMMAGDDFNDDTDEMDWSGMDGGDMPYIPGNPGSYYGGYGSCYNCGARGHWSVGCPLR